MLRRLITICFAISLSLCAIVTILWLLTYLRYDSIIIELPHSCVQITNRWGRLRIIFNPVQGPQEFKVDNQSRGWLHTDNYRYFLHNEPVVPWIHVDSGHSTIVQLPHWVLVVVLGAGAMPILLRLRKRGAKARTTGADPPVLHPVDANQPAILAYERPVECRRPRRLIAAALIASVIVSMSFASLRRVIVAPFLPQSPNGFDFGDPDMPPGWDGNGILLPTDDPCGT